MNIKNLCGCCGIPLSFPWTRAIKCTLRSINDTDTISNRHRYNLCGFYSNIQFNKDLLSNYYMPGTADIVMSKGDPVYGNY